MFVQGDEPADQGAPRLCRQLQSDMLKMLFFKIISHIIMARWRIKARGCAEGPTCGCRSKLLHGWKCASFSFWSL